MLKILISDFLNSCIRCDMFLDWIGLDWFGLGWIGLVLDGMGLGREDKVGGYGMTIF